METKGKILVVDDDIDICEILCAVLDLEGYEAVFATNGYKALDEIKENDFDVVILDIRMNGIDGMETLRRIKVMRPHQSVIMISAFAVEDTIREALKSGAFTVMHKPVDNDVLIQNIEAARKDGAMILVVDDDEDLCDTMSGVLKREGYVVGVAHDGISAVNETIEKDYDLVILDMKLPAMNGLEAYLRIREMRPNIVAIVISGYDGEMGGMARMAVEKNAYVYLRKPLDIEDFLGLLNDIIEKKRSGHLEKPS